MPKTVKKKKKVVDLQARREEQILEFIDERLEDIERRPEMWGGIEAMEMQYLQLLEMRLMHVHPQRFASNRRYVLDKYIDYIQKLIPHRIPAYLSKIYDTHEVIMRQMIHFRNNLLSV